MCAYISMWMYVCAYAGACTYVCTDMHDKASVDVTE